MNKYTKYVGADAPVRPTSKARQNKGITLIALVITIIVMLILVAVTINMAVNGGLFEYAGKAVSETQNAIDKEQELANGGITIGNTYYNSIDEYINNNQTTVEKGAFVQYDVEYTDVYYDSYTYTSTNGWRLLHYTDNGDGTISDVELISTGVPAKLYYYYNSSADWWVTDKATEFQTALQNYYEKEENTYTFSSSTGNNVKATAGMYYNFENIPFYTESNYNAITTTSGKYNLGWYRSIKKNGTEATANTNGSVFLTSNDYSVRMLTLPKINNDRSSVDGITITSTTQISSEHEPAKGLYRLEQLSSVLSGYTYSSGLYWLASPRVSNSFSVYCVRCNDDVNYSGSNTERCSPRSFSRV